MWPWRFAIAGGALSQIAVGSIVYSAALGDERGRLGLAVCGLAGGMALLGLAAKPVRAGAAGLNGLLFLLCTTDGHRVAGRVRPTRWFAAWGLVVPSDGSTGGCLHMQRGGAESAARPQLAVRRRTTQLTGRIAASFCIVVGVSYLRSVRSSTKRHIAADVLDESLGVT